MSWHFSECFLWYLLIVLFYLVVSLVGTKFIIMLFCSFSKCIYGPYLIWRIGFWALRFFISSVWSSYISCLPTESLLWAQMMEGVPPFHLKSTEEAVKLMCLEGKRPPFKIKTKSYPPDLKELVIQFKVKKVGLQSLLLFRSYLTIMVYTGWLRSVGIQNMLSDQHFLRSLYGWTKLLPIAQNKDGGKRLLNFLGMFLRPIISYRISLDEFKLKALNISRLPWNYKINHYLFK